METVFQNKPVVFYVDPDIIWRYRIKNFFGTYFDVRLFDDLIKAKDAFTKCKTAPVVLCEVTIHSQNDGYEWVRKLWQDAQAALVFSVYPVDHIPWQRKSDNSDSRRKLLEVLLRLTRPIVVPPI